MEASPSMCSDGACARHFHEEDPVYVYMGNQQQSPMSVANEPSTSLDGEVTESSISPKKDTWEAEKKQSAGTTDQSSVDHGFQRIIRNFTPSYVSFDSAH